MSIYDTLNEQQKEAVFNTEGAVLVLAGAGSGKTRALTHRIAYLVDELGVSPFNIMAITFTNKAAGEMKERVENLVGVGSDAIWVSTFHSSCVKILRRFADRLGYDNNFTIYDTDDSKVVMKNVCKKLNIDTKMLKERTILNAISAAKNELIGVSKFRQENQGDFRMAKIVEAYSEYQETLIKNNAMDFDDLLMNAVELFMNNPDVLDNYQKRFRYIMVDEYQDTNTAQFRFINLLSGPKGNICVVGDDDQSIYKFRGANIRNILDFEKYYPDAKVIRLEQNYRSTQNILDAANAVIANNFGRKAKSLWTEHDKGNRIHFRQFDTAYEEAEYVAGDIASKVRKGLANNGECAVLYRTNAQSRLLEERFVYEGIPYNVVGGVNFYARREIKDIISYLKTIDNGRDDLCVKRIINVPKRGIGATSVAKVETYATVNDISFFDACSKAKEIPGMGKAGEKIQNFADMISLFRARMGMYKLSELVRDVLEETKYIQEFDAETEEEAEARIDNIEELINKTVAYEQEHEDATLSTFLEEVALVADIDQLKEDVPRVVLMTLHAAKGLEFKHVYMTGMEDGLFPGYMSTMADDPGELEEERRLAYVGITRAKEDLTLCYSRSRMMHGETQYNAVSRFVKEIPKDLLDNTIPGRKYDDYSDSRSVGSGVNKSYGQYGNADRSSVTESSYSSKAYARPIAILREKKTPDDVKPLSAKIGMDAMLKAGVSKGMPNQGSMKPEYEIGDRVKHIKFGEGTVNDLEPGARDYKVTVDFDDAGTKVMYAAFAKLVKI